MSDCASSYTSRSCFGVKITDGTSNDACSPSTSSTCFSTFTAERIEDLNRTLPVWMYVSTSSSPESVRWSRKSAIL